VGVYNGMLGNMSLSTMARAYAAAVCALGVVTHASPDRLGCLHPWTGKISGMGKPTIEDSGEGAHCEMAGLPSTFQANSEVCLHPPTRCLHCRSPSSTSSAHASSKLVVRHMQITCTALRWL
jgi:hypothetical protein